MCGLFGFVNYSNVINLNDINTISESLAAESEIRGSHATGYTYINSNNLNICKMPTPAHRVNFNFKETTPVLMGHTRHATQGDAMHNQNNHPFAGKTRDKTLFALAHNGVLSNDSSLRKKFHLHKTKIATDSYIAVQLLETKRSLNFESLSFMAEEVVGTFTFTVLDVKSNLYIVKGDSPLSMLHFKNLGLYIYASTDDILWRALCSTCLIYEVKRSLNSADSIENMKIDEGDILCIDSKGKMTRSAFNYTEHRGYNWWEYLRCTQKPSICNENYDYIGDLCSAAKYMDIDEDDIELLIEFGYSSDEIEDLLYDRAAFAEAVNLIKCDY